LQAHNSGGLTDSSKLIRIPEQVHSNEMSNDEINNLSASSHGNVSF
jgi:GDP-D-mannose dehydratase